jgi:hypothetical protein
MYNGIQIGTEAYERAIKKFGYHPSTNDPLEKQNQFLDLAAKIQIKLNELDKLQP